MNQERLKPQEDRNIEERSKVDALRGSPMTVGTLEEISIYLSLSRIRVIFSTTFQLDFLCYWTWFTLICQGDIT